MLQLEREKFVSVEVALYVLTAIPNAPLVKLPVPNNPPPLQSMETLSAVTLRQVVLSVTGITVPGVIV